MNRHQFHASWHNYNNGVYFVTICSHEKQLIFGKISTHAMHMSELGMIVEGCIKEIPSHHDDVEICNYVVMPNHIHIVMAVGTRYIASANKDTEKTCQPNTADVSLSGNRGCLKAPKHGGECLDFHHNSKLAVIIGSFKAAVTRRANSSLICGRDVSRPYWQLRYHEHIIRNQHAFDNIMAYIDSNVEKWDSDCFNKSN